MNLKVTNWLKCVYLINKFLIIQNSGHTYIDGDVKIDKDLKEDFLKPGFENIDILKEFEKKKAEIMDTDLDGE